MVETLEGRVLEDWTRARTSSGVPYYVNHCRGITQWDHPEYIRIMEEVLSANSVKYAAYRTACKLRRLQTRLKLNEVSLQCVASAFDSAGLRAGENSDMVEVSQIEQVIHQVLRTTHKHRQVRVMLASHLALNLLLNIFDPKRNGMVQVLGCKVLMIVLCGGRLQEKYRYLFTQIADHNNCCTRRKLAGLLRDLARIPELLSEQPSFGVSLVSAAVESCFKEVGGEVGITEEVLLAWLLQEPQTLVWWTTLYRLTAAELVCHDVKCGVCKQRPIIGLRYQCLRCLGYNLCQDCFLHARTSRRHKITHPIQEYCHETTGKEWRRALMKTLRYRLSSNRAECNQQRYLAIGSNPEAGCSLSSLLCEERGNALWKEGNSEDSDGEEELMSRTIMHSREELDSSHSGDSNSQDSGRGSRDLEDGSEPVILPNSPRHQIHSVIMHLQDGHRQLEDESNGKGVRNSTVEQHTQQLQTQINRLKSILQAFNTGANGMNEGSNSDGNQRCNKRGLPRLESTPIVGERGLLLNLSPIATQTANDTAVLDNKENHLAENPPETPSKSHSGTRPLRMPFTPQDRNTDTNSPVTNPLARPSSLVIGGVKNLGQVARLPSFTEVNFSDLTCLTSGKASGATSPTEPLKEVISDGFDDDAARDVKQELENILKQLDHIFPLSESEGENFAAADTGGVIEAACELGDVLAEYVNAVPVHQSEHL